MPETSVHGSSIVKPSRRAAHADRSNAPTLKRGKTPATSQGRGIDNVKTAPARRLAGARRITSFSSGCGSFEGPRTPRPRLMQLTPADEETSREYAFQPSKSGD